MRIFYSTNYVGSGHDFDTTRKARWIADSLIESPIAGIDLVEPVPLARRQVTEVHDPEYVRAVETGSPRDLAESQGFAWDPGLWPMVLSSNGGAVAAELTALQHGTACVAFQRPAPCPSRERGRLLHLQRPRDRRPRGAGGRSEVRACSGPRRPLRRGHGVA